ncbi:MAG: nickel pincer cofactor biosynthesis protein LarC [Acidimicrobiales bacterium]
MSTNARRRLSAADAASPSRGRRIAWFHCFAGIAGDMALGSLIDAGADLDEVRSLLARLAIDGWSLETVPVLRGGIAATQVVVTVNETSVVRTFPHILGILDEAKLPPRVRDRAVATFSALAAVESRLHRRPTSQVHFHEVGGHDTIVDVVGTAAALEVLGVDEVLSSPVAMGNGMVRTSHGLLPNPSPAVLGLLEEAPVWGRDLNIELTTPTGAAILAAMSTGFGPMPDMVVGSTGYGAGSREIDGLPNCTQVIVGWRATTETPEGTPYGQPLVLLEANLDDATGEQLADALGALLEAGANDAWVTPVVMKKGRPGHVLSVLADRALVDQLSTVLTGETGTLGVRASEVGRMAAARRLDHVEVDGSPIRVKVSAGRVKVEHDDAVELAHRSGRPVREVIERAERAWWEQADRRPEPPEEA